MKNVGMLSCAQFSMQGEECLLWLGLVGHALHEHSHHVKQRQSLFTGLLLNSHSGQGCKALFVHLGQQRLEHVPSRGSERQVPHAGPQLDTASQQLPDCRL
ncbi:hypothetical protein HaLaN_16512 [Haematococcus lacustris]|uniref:Uncharacterized protein n=1 Tax=Haematococcus lacustris TaxID=44745 RepID=A0A699ZE56_HAELA|nr:hypothetical protein HaLaN_16512 [Haematococcus lacustris]